MPAPKKNPAAVALGKLAKGKPKTMTPAALAQRRAAGDKASSASFARKILSKATIEAAKAAARDESMFSAPPPEWDAE